jgi:ABC-type glycerol-3-phosphate transport system permease component
MVVSRGEHARLGTFSKRLSSARLFGRIVWRLILYAVAAAFFIAYIAPLLWAASTSLKSEPQVYTVPPIWIPNPIVWRNYPDALTRVPFGRYTLNTLKIALPVVCGSVVSNAIVACGFARLRWRYRDFFFYVCIATMIIPFQVTMIPLFITFTKLNWVNTFLPLIVPAFFANPWNTFLLRQFFLTIPQELSDAARVDGCSEWGILLRIILPLSVPALAVVALFNFMGAWNDYLGPLIYLNRDELYTVAIGLSRFQASERTSARWPWLMAATMATITPILVLFFLAQRTFIEGITLTGIKG